MAAMQTVKQNYKGKNMTAEFKPGPHKSKIDDDDKEKPIIAKTPTDLQRLRLEKLMKHPDKPVPIPERPKEKNTPHVPDFVRNVMGSSAGAGSGEFHVYRHLRRKEYARQKFIQEKAEKELRDEEYHQKLEDNQKKADERTAKKREKRLKKKQKQKQMKKIKATKVKDEIKDSESETEESETEETYQTETNELEKRGENQDEVVDTKAFDTSNNVKTELESSEQSSSEVKVEKRDSEGSVEKNVKQECENKGKSDK